MAKSIAPAIKATGFCLASLKQDHEKIEKGVLIPFMSEASLRICRYGSHAFNGMLSKAFKENETIIKAGGEQGDIVATQNMVFAFANHILVGWEGVVDEDGNEVKYSVDQAEEYLKIPEIYEFVEFHAKKHENFRINSVKELGEELKK